jgi:hypothetical protein
MSSPRPTWANAGVTTAGVLLSLAVFGGGAIAQSAAASPDPLVNSVPGASSVPASVAPQLDVNAATQEEIAAAFAAAGISNADRWAREVVEYRPYEVDPTWARLRQELSKYNIDPAILEQIIAVIDGIPDASPTPGASPVTAALIPVNTATQEEIGAAFAAAGISNADRWAREVVEYRPYEADPTWARLRQELGKYNIDPAVLEQIIALLSV